MNQFLIVIALLVVVLIYALHRKSDVKAALKTSLFEFSLDAKQSGDPAARPLPCPRCVQEDNKCAIPEQHDGKDH